MRLYEYEGKIMFRAAGIDVPSFMMIKGEEEIGKIIPGVSFPAVLKAQVLTGGRGKSGGVKVVKDQAEALATARQLMGLRIKGETVDSLMVSEYIDITREMYLSITVDRSKRSYLILASPTGGIDIESLVKDNPEKVSRIYINPGEIMADYAKRKVAKALMLSGNEASLLFDLLNRMFNDVMKKYQADLVEINPLALTKDGRLIAVDSKVTIDDNVQPSIIGQLERLLGRNPSENADERFKYVQLDGNIGVIGNGAGLTMATMDLLKSLGGSPADFLDIGGGADKEVVNEAFKRILERDDIKTIFVNILGGITRCDEVAGGLIAALSTVKDAKLVVRLSGTNEEEGRKILKDAGIATYGDMLEAARAAVSLTRES
ncbi:MAG: ADP-forming succinate--CoA ligase subunit beta [Nitrososphaerota archaeon]|nr:ADP-forming succinate--CoA ligase subunit beta [Nitrososphaerota archaeon]